MMHSSDDDQHARLKKILETYGQSLRIYACTWVKDPEQVYDIVNDAILDLFGPKGKVPPAGKEKFHLYTRVRWRCYNALETGKRKKLTEKKYEQWLLSTPDSNEQIKELEEREKMREELLQRLRTEIGNLPPREKEIMELILARVPVKQIAQQLDLSPQTVRNVRGKVINKLREALKDRGLLFLLFFFLT